MITIGTQRYSFLNSKIILKKPPVTHVSTNIHFLKSNFFINRSVKFLKFLVKHCLVNKRYNKKLHLSLELTFQIIEN